ncbi:unnamed protein product, partial [Brenthis ino]
MEISYSDSELTFRPVDPRRSAGPAPHRPPRGAISHTRARLSAARRPTDARHLAAEPSTYKPQDMPPSTAARTITHHKAQPLLTSCPLVPSTMRKLVVLTPLE